MFDKLRCVKCGSSEYISPYNFSKNIQTGGSKISSRGWKQITTFSTTFPVCFRCQKGFRKYNSKMAAYICISLILFVIGVFGLISSIFPSFNLGGSIAFITVLIIAFGLLIYGRISGRKINPNSYMKFRKRNRSFYVKPQNASKWILQQEWMNMDEVINLHQPQNHPIEQTNNVISNVDEIINSNQSQNPPIEQTPNDMPNNAKEFYVGAINERIRGDNIMALNFIISALEIEPNNLRMLNCMGDILKKMGKIKEAIECYETALEIDPTNFIALNRKERLLRYS